MDNVEGHGENEYVLYYSEYLEANYSIVFLHQVLWYPKTNMLDLGAWITMQSKVEKYHCRNIKQHDALARSINDSWRDMEAQKLTNIWNFLLTVLDLIIQYQGVNELVL